jgi:serine/threonine protein kinase
MHELGFAHNDIKPDNLLLSIVDGVPVIVLCDFGLSSRSDKVDQARGTDGYRYLYSTPITGLHTDFWALGLLSCHIAIGKRFIEAWDQVGIGQDGTTQSALHHLACA